jgi:hypothetical protein
MNSAQEDHYGMYLKVDLFLTGNAGDLAYNPAIATTRTVLNSFINLIAQADSTATRDITGFTLAKNTHRKEQIANFKLIKAALVGYFIANPDIKSKTIIDFTNSEIDKFRDAELYMKTDQVLDLALPVKALLVPYGVAGAQVDALETLNNAWQALEPIGRKEEGVNKAAGEDVDRYMVQITDLLKNTLDGYMEVVEFNNPNLFSQYLTARMIDDTGGNSGTEDYEVNNYTIPGGGSVIIPVGANPIPPDTELYIRVVPPGGGVVICTTGMPASPCVAGFMLASGETFKGPASALGIDLMLPNLQITNPGLDDVVVRAGVKNEK